MSTVEEILNAAKALPPEDQAELKRRLELLAAADDDGGLQLQNEASVQAKELHERIHRAMYEAGLVSSISPPIKRRRERPPPIKIKGKPLSETIIEDRR